MPSFSRRLFAPRGPVRLADLAFRVAPQFTVAFGADVLRRTFVEVGRLERRPGAFGGVEHDHDESATESRRPHSHSSQPDHQ